MGARIWRLMQLLALSIIAGVSRHWPRMRPFEVAFSGRWKAATAPSILQSNPVRLQPCRARRFLQA